MKISIIIPCYNEKNYIIEILKKINSVKNLDFEIIIIDDASTDGSQDLIKLNSNLYTKLLINEKNYGKGYSVNKGIQQANNEIIIIQDADLEYDPNDYHNLLKPIINNNADVVYGTRFYGGSSRKIHFFWHTQANKLLTFFCNLRTNLNLSDMECGYKVLKKDVIKKIQLKEKRFGFEPELTIKLAKKKFSFYEVGVNYYGRSYQEGKKISLKDAFRALFIIFMLYY